MRWNKRRIMLNYEDCTLVILKDKTPSHSIESNFESELDEPLETPFLVYMR